MLLSMILSRQTLKVASKCDFGTYHICKQHRLRWARTPAQSCICCLHMQSMDVDEVRPKIRPHTLLDRSEWANKKGFCTYVLSTILSCAGPNTEVNLWCYTITLCHIYMIMRPYQFLLNPCIVLLNKLTWHINFCFPASSVWWPPIKTVDSEAAWETMQILIRGLTVDSDSADPDQMVYSGFWQCRSWSDGLQWILTVQILIRWLTVDSDSADPDQMAYSGFWQCRSWSDGVQWILTVQILIRWLAVDSDSADPDQMAYSGFWQCRSWSDGVQWILTVQILIRWRTVDSDSADPDQMACSGFWQCRSWSDGLQWILTVQILIRWLRQKPADLDLHCFLKSIILGPAG